MKNYVNKFVPIEFFFFPSLVPSFKGVSHEAPTMLNVVVLSQHFGLLHETYIGCIRQFLLIENVVYCGMVAIPQDYYS